MRRALATAVATVAALASAQAHAAAAQAATYAPPDRPGPALTVPQAQLDASLACTKNLTTDAREPVLLVAGTTLTPDINYSWNYERALAYMGWPYCAVTLPNHEMSDIQISGEYIVNAIRTMHQRTNRKVEYLGYSQGGMVGRWALRFWPDTRSMVDDYVGIDPSNHGTLDANGLCLLTCAPAIWQQQAGAHFLAALNSYQETFPGISYTVIYSNTDEIVVPNFGPGALSRLKDATNIAIQEICPLDISEHIAMGTTDAVAYALFHDAITHAGPAERARIGPRTCLHPLMPGVNPHEVLAKQGVVGLTAGEQVATYPHISHEPALAPYVFAAN